uniref:Uncharacterized protein n=1 Tax=Cacopsylla melanoneura TaxID=428564 RepID=A0A8D9F7K3_9HEMI
MVRPTHGGYTPSDITYYNVLTALNQMKPNQFAFLLFDLKFKIFRLCYYFFSLSLFPSRSSQLKSVDEHNIKNLTPNNKKDNTKNGAILKIKYLPTRVPTYQNDL